MEAVLRKPCQGVWNIVRFNWHYYLVALVAVVLLLLAQYYFHPLGVAGYLPPLLIIFLTLISLAVSFYVYDRSSLYKLSSLQPLHVDAGESIINIHAGFDETSRLLQNRFKTCTLMVADFYDPARHTEISIKRARAAYPSYPGTQAIDTSQLPFQNRSLDKVFLFMAAHEIRDTTERIGFFRELNRTLKE